MVLFAGFNTETDAKTFLSQNKKKLLNAMIISNDENAREFCYYKLARDYCKIKQPFCVMWLHF